MRTLAAVFVLAVLSGCVVTPEAGEGGTNQNTLTREEIVNSGQTNLYDAVMRLRPRWIRPSTLVYMDGISMGETDALRDLPFDTAIQMEWLDPMQAAQQLPNINPSNLTGVIIVRTRAP
jgi:hypothetical protein